jgi:SAM-dependent methyltransferase
MTFRRCVHRDFIVAVVFAAVFVTGTVAGPLSPDAQAQAQGQAKPEPFQPEVGQPGKDVVWVPSPPETVNRMLDVAQLTPQDFVVDLGSGDGRNIIEAARRGARALGVEYNPDMVELSKRNAAAAGVGDRAQFVQGDMFATDFSKATVLALFLLPSNLLQLRSKFLDLQPGTRIVANTFSIQDWTPDQTETLDNCSSWCTVMLYIVPAKVGGTWRIPQGELALQQNYQMVTGTLTANGMTTPVNGRLRGEQLTLTAGTQELMGRVNGNVIEGTLNGASGATRLTATRAAE